MKTSNMLKLLKIWNQLGFGDQELEEVQFLELGPFKDLRIEEKGRLELPNKGEIEKRWREHIRLHPLRLRRPPALPEYSQERRGSFNPGSEEDCVQGLRRNKAWRDQKGSILQKTRSTIFSSLPIGVGAISLTEDDRIVFGVREKVGIGKGEGDKPAGRDSSILKAIQPGVTVSEGS